MTGWIRAATVTELPEGASKLLRHGDKRVAVFRTGAGVHAVDNRCPHEGYALVAGAVRDGVLTCAWHNWKFRLDDGACLFGGESVRSYPTAVRDGAVWVDLTDPSEDELATALFADVREAIGEVDVGRIARGTMRLDRLGRPLAELIAEGVRYGAPRAEYGWNHSLATLADCLRLSTALEGTLGALPVVQGLSVVSETEVRRPDRPRPEPVDPATYGSIGEALAAFPQLVDDERAEEAEGLLRGLLAAGVGPVPVRRALLTAITDHFLGYGHPLIYTQKAFDLLDTLGWGEADTVLGPLVPAIVLSTRYDQLPYMRRFLTAWTSAAPDLDALLRRPATGRFEAARFERDLLDGSPEGAFGAVLGALDAGTAVTDILDATARAAAERLRRFDLDTDLDDTNEWGWLDVTHTLTYLDALRWAWSREPSAAVLRGVFHAAWFVQWTGQLDGDRTPAPAVATDDPGAVLRSIRRRDPEAAEAAVAGYRGPAAPLERMLAQAATEDTSVRPIMVAHAVKTTQASIVEARALGRGGVPDRAPMAAAARFLAAPKRERWVHHLTLEAIAMVHGRGRGDRAPG